MIKLTRPKKPQILVDNQERWQKALNDATVEHGSYKDIPKEEKERLLKHYRHKDIQTALFNSSAQKCAFCENSPTESGHIEVEHFKPKSLYTDLTFEWENLLPSCKKCNNSKLSHDTVTEPIVNPFDEEPSDFFYYEDIRIKPIDDNVPGDKTITVCGLNKPRLMGPRGKLLTVLHEFADNLEDALNDYYKCTTNIKRMNRMRKIAESINTIEELTQPEQTYSAYATYYLDNCSEYIEAKKIVDEAFDE